MENALLGITIAGLPVAIMMWFFLIRDDIQERRERKRKALKKASKKERKRLKALTAENA